MNTKILRNIERLLAHKLQAVQVLKKGRVFPTAVSAENDLFWQQDTTQDRKSFIIQSNVLTF